MLVAMTFNIWLILALTITSGVAMAVFGKLEDSLYIDSLQQEKEQSQTRVSVNECNTLA